jgi:hypothetical protein
VRQRKFPPFITTDTALATFLSISEIPIASIDTARQPVEFIFNDPDNKIGALLIEWQSRRAVGNLWQFHQQYRYLLRRVHGRDNNNG